jgi:N-acetylmuramoyl-L-alanine amidase
MTASLPLRPGTSGEPVRDLQRRLGRAGHDADADPPGRYGPATEQAVRAFQERRGLRVDGICGEQTWSSLVEAGLLLGDRLLYLRAPMLRGDDVAELQRLLGQLGFDAGKVDGILGPRTSDATIEFQRNAGLTTDGIAGPDTVDALRRYGAKAEENGPSSTVASLREAEGLRTASRLVHGLRVAIAEGGGLGALADAVARALADDGAVVTVVWGADESGRAAGANAFEASVFLAFAARPEPGASCAYYAREGFESVGGHRLAALVADALSGCGLGGPVGDPRGMRLPVLRETRMPAVVVEIGPPAELVLRTPALAEAVAAAVQRWVAAPVEA